jgi:pimeloyl-[acyl-carrier protein] methyl ester esterase
MARYWDEMMATDLRDVVSGIDIPWLVTHGAQSRVYPGETARWLAATAPRAQLATFAQSGHSPHLEEPKEFARVLAEFEARL